jgi:hypothetical protein
MEKSANKRWKESGTTLSFKEWIDRENKKKESEETFLNADGVGPSNVFEQTIDSTLNTSKEYIKTAGLKHPDSEDKNKVFGLDKRVLVFSTVLIVGSLTYFFYQKLKNKK